MRCANCGAVVPSRFCPDCGQAASAGARLTWASLAAAVAASFDLDRGLLHTARALTCHPGRTIRAYLDGRRVVFTGPVKYVLVMVSVALVAVAFVMPPPPPAADPLVGRLNALLVDWGNALLAATVPLFAGVTWLLFRRAGRTYAEHLALNAYVVGQQNLLSFAVLPLPYLGRAAMMAGTTAYWVACVAYLAIALRAVVARTWPGALGGAIVVCVGGYGITLFAVILWLLRNR